MQEPLNNTCCHLFWPQKLSLSLQPNLKVQLCIQICLFFSSIILVAIVLKIVHLVSFVVVFA